MTTHRVLLLHGLWMRPASLAVLARRLSRAGFAPERIGYASVRGGPALAIRDLARAARRSPCHVVAHSLGGLVTLAALEREPDLPIERVVCLGSPLCGSAAADGLARLPMIGATLGRSRELLREGCRPWQGRAQVGMIAGDRPLGLGQVLGRFDGDSDGTVAVAETRLAGLADHVVVPASHTGLVFSPLAARQAVAFLRDGRFER
jgi:pimeloyl-ACP methyl ester carboxylesterase